MDVGSDSKKKNFGVEVFPALPSVSAAASTMLTSAGMSKHIATQ